MNLTHKQTIALDLLEDRQHTEIVFGGGAGGGKSVLGCVFILQQALKFPGTRWVIGRAALKTLKETTLNTFWQVAALQGITASHYKFNEVKGLIKLVNGSEILLKDLAYYPSDPNYDDLGSLEITGAFVDECNQVEQRAWKILKSRIRYRLDEYGLMPKILGTCNPSKGWVFTDFWDSNQRGVLAKHCAFVQSLIGDNAFISKHYRDNLLTLDNASIERLLKGNWNYDEDPRSLCDYDAICDMFRNEHVLPTDEIYGCADLAMQGRDMFVTGYWRGRVGHVDRVLAKSSGKVIEEVIRDMMKARRIPHSKMVVDSTGLGAFLESYINGIKEFNFAAGARDKQYANLKSECGYKLAEMINKRELYVLCTPEQQEMMKAELGQLKADAVDKDTSRKRIIGKDDMKAALGRSPDYLDWLILRMWFETQPEAGEAYLIHSRSRRVGRR